MKSNHKNIKPENPWQFETDTGRYAQTLSKMIQFKTVSDKKDSHLPACRELIHYLKKRFPHIAGGGHWEDINGGMMIRITGSNSRSPLLLMSHLDVVEARGKWEQEPFSGLIEENRVWGRGAVDTKGALCAIFEAVESLMAEGVKFERDLYIFSSSREEIAGNDAQLAVEKLKAAGVRPGLVIDEGGAMLDEPMSGIKGRFAMIAMAERAGAKLTLTTGKQGRRSAASVMATFMLEVEKHPLSPRNFPPEVKAMFKVLAPRMNFPMKGLFGNLALFKPLLIRLIPKLSPEAAAMIGATVAFSNLDEEETASLDHGQFGVKATIASTWYHDIHESTALFRKLAKRYGVEITAEEIRTTVRPEPLDSEGYRFTSKLVRKIFPEVTPVPFLLFGGTDARHFIGYADQVIRFAPLFFTREQFQSVHNKNEQINVNSLAGAVRFYRQAILDYPRFKVK